MGSRVGPVSTGKEKCYCEVVQEDRAEVEAEAETETDA